MKVLGLIPARGGSKGIPRKNIKVLAGKPLISYTIDSAKLSERLSNVIVSTNDHEIANVATDLGLKVPFIRPDNLAEDSSPTLPVIKHALQFFAEKNEFFDAVCLLQVTSPFRDAGFIDKAIHQFESSEADALVSVKTVPHEYNPHWIFEPDENGQLHIATGEKSIISRRQDLPDAYMRDGSIYITKVKTIVEENSLYGSKLTYIINDSDFHVNLDTLADWHQAKEMAPRYLEVLKTSK